MEHPDMLLPLLILGTLGAILLVLLRRGMREPLQQRAAGAAPMPPAVAPAATLNMTQAPPVNAVIVQPEPPREKAAPVAESSGDRSAIDTLFGMIGDERSLAAAFILREVFDLPVSRRRR